MCFEKKQKNIWWISGIICKIKRKNCEKVVDKYFGSAKTKIVYLVINSKSKKLEENGNSLKSANNIEKHSSDFWWKINLNEKIHKNNMVKCDYRKKKKM